MSTTTQAGTRWPLVSVSAAARIVGVSTARVYQRISETAEGTRIPAVTVPVSSKGRELTPRLRVDIVTVLEWRREREVLGQEVGPVPPAYQAYVVPLPPPRPAPIETPFGPVGLPATRPF